MPADDLEARVAALEAALATALDVLRDGGVRNTAHREAVNAAMALLPSQGDER